MPTRSTGSLRTILILTLFAAGCTPRSPLAAIANPPAAAQPTPAVDAGPGIDAQWQQALEAARSSLRGSLDGPALEQAQQSLQAWADVNAGEIEYQKTHGEVSANSQGEPTFTGRSAQWFASLLANLDLLTRAEIKWANYQERAPAARETAIAAVQDFAGPDVSVTYLKTERFIFDPLRMVEDYLANGFIYRVDVESGKILQIEPRQDAAFSTASTGGVDVEAGRRKAAEIIGRLAPGVDLAQLTYAENVDPGYYRWEDRAAERLPDGQYRALQVVFAPDGEFFSYLDTLPAPE